MNPAIHSLPAHSMDTDSAGPGAGGDGARHDAPPRRPSSGGPMGHSRPDAPAEGRSIAGPRRIATGIAPLDERTGGLDAGGVYLVIGQAGAARLIALLHFVHAGLENDERVALLTMGSVDTTLDIADAWGLDLRGAWSSGQLTLLGYRDDFERRAVRSTAPGEIIAEFDALLPDDATRVAVHPGGALLGDGEGFGLGAAFLNWARQGPATVCISLLADQDRRAVAAPDWTVPLISGALAIEPRDGRLLQATLAMSVPRPDRDTSPVTLALESGRGLVQPTSFPGSRTDDLGERDPNRVLLLTLGGRHGDEITSWAATAFDAQIVDDPLEAIVRAQHSTGWGAVLVHAPRARVDDAIRACRALRPLTGGGIVFASDDEVRSSDRVALLEAGCDDTVSGGIDFRELEVRLRQIAATGARTRKASSPEARGPAPGRVKLGGRVPVATLADVVGSRLSDHDADPFSLLVLSPDSPELCEELAALLAAVIRVEEGDLIASGGDRIGVLLEGARGRQAQAFLQRFHEALEPSATPGFTVDVASHPSDSGRVARSIEGLHARRV